MKMNFTYVIMALAAIVACNKIDSLNTEETQEEQKTVSPETRQITLNVSIEGGEDETKVSYSEDGYALKCKWSAGDQVTLVTYNATESSSTLATIDNLALSSGANSTTGSFTGTITGTPGAHFYVIYPAVTQTTTPPYKSELIPSDVPSSQARGSIIDIQQGDPFVLLTLKMTHIMKQQGAKTLNHLRYCPMTGYGTITGGTLSSVTLRQECSILKISVTLPDSWNSKTIYGARIYNGGSANFYTTAGRQFRNTSSFGVSGATSSEYGPVLYFGSYWDADFTPVKPAGLKVEYITNKEMVIYYPYIPNLSKDFNTGNTLKLQGYYDLSLEAEDIASKTLTTTVDNDRGKIYRISF